MMTQSEMSSWYDILTFHLRNGSFREENNSLLSPLPCRFLPGSGSREQIRQRFAKLGSWEEAGAQEENIPSFLFHSNSCENENVGREAEKLRKCGYRTKTLEWFACG